VVGRDGGRSDISQPIRSPANVLSRGQLLPLAWIPHARTVLASVHISCGCGRSFSWCPQWGQCERVRPSRGPRHFPPPSPPRHWTWYWPWAIGGEEMKSPFGQLSCPFAHGYDQRRQEQEKDYRKYPHAAGDPLPAAAPRAGIASRVGPLIAQLGSSQSRRHRPAGVNGAPSPSLPQAAAT
jgi:hypothetical protein